MGHKGENETVSAMRQCSIMVKYTVSRVRLLGFRSQLCHLEACDLGQVISLLFASVSPYVK